MIYWISGILLFMIGAFMWLFIAAANVGVEEDDFDYLERLKHIKGD